MNSRLHGTARPAISWPMIRLALALLLIVAVARPVLAQPSRAAPSPAPEAQSLPPPPYEPQLLRLSEIMGALHYLRGLCQSPEGLAWRREMQALLDAEAGTSERRERLTQAFNRGYIGFEQSHRSCTPTAQLVARRYLEEGQRLLRDVTQRYVN
ncbi:MAG: TIGR02301 family protein [Alphaproteobacteria bacterium]